MRERSAIRTERSSGKLIPPLRVVFSGAADVLPGVVVGVVDVMATLSLHQLAEGANNVAQHTVVTSGD